MVTMIMIIMMMKIKHTCNPAADWDIPLPAEDPRGLPTSSLRHLDSPLSSEDDDDFVHCDAIDDDDVGFSTPDFDTIFDHHQMVASFSEQDLCNNSLVRDSR